MQAAVKVEPRLQGRLQDVGKTRTWDIFCGRHIPRDTWAENGKSGEGWGGAANAYQSSVHVTTVPNAGRQETAFTYSVGLVLTLIIPFLVRTSFFPL